MDKNEHKPKTWLSVNTPQFQSDQADFLATKPTHEMIIFTKFHKNCGFFTKSQLLDLCTFFIHPLGLICTSVCQLLVHSHSFFAGNLNFFY